MSKAWQQLSKRKKEEVGYMCNRCGIVQRRMITHHTVYLTDDNLEEYGLDEDCLEVLCIECHNTEHSTRVSKYPQMLFNEDGSIKGTC